MRREFCFILICLGLSTAGYAQANNAAKAFAKLKSLEGRWRVTSEKGHPLYAEYSVGSNGSTVLEKFEGMLTVFYMDHDTLMATHFCDVGNQPRFIASQVTEGANGEVSQIQFVFKDITNLANADDGYMKDARYQFTNTNKLTTVWTWHDKKGDSEVEINVEREQNVGAYVIELKTVKAQPTFVEKGTASLAGLGDALGAAFASVGQQLGASGVKPTGAPFARYLKFSEESIEFEAGFPIAAGSIQNGVSAETSELPAGEVATTQHVGSQETSAEAYKALHAWMAKSGYQEAGAPWEVYLDDPEHVPQDKQRTLIYYPVKKKAHTHKH